MKNLFLLPTDKPSRFYSTAQTETKKRGYSFGEHYIPNTRNMFSNHNIYITSDEEIKEGDWVIYTNGIVHCQKMDYKEDLSNVEEFNAKKIILTTDQELIKGGVQAIDDEFLEWFVKNPNCEEFDIMTDAFTVKEMSMLPIGTRNLKYKIIIPKEEPKQSAVEWLQEQLNKILIDNQIQQTLHLFEQAKEMENQRKRSGEEDLKRAYFSGIRSTGEGRNGEYANGSRPDVEKEFGESFNEWLEKFKTE